MSRPNFRIIENHNDYDEIYPEFEKLYKTVTIPKKEIMRQLDISKNRYVTLRKMFKERTGFMRKGYGKGEYVLIPIKIKKNNNEK